MAAALTVQDPAAAQSVGTELATEGDALIRRLGDGPVCNLYTLDQAVRDRQDLGRAIKAGEAYFGPLKKMAHQLWRALCERENQILDPLRRADHSKALAISAYKAAEDVRRREAERVEEDRRRIEREADAVAEAAILERQGDHALAAAVVAEAVAAPAPVVVLPDLTRQVDGLKFTRRWHARIVSPALVPREYLIVDEKRIGAYARAMKESARIPGIDFYFTDDPVR